MAFVLKTLATLALMSGALSQHGPAPYGAAGGYSYNKFSGPVSGKIHQITVPAAGNLAAQHHADYGYDHATGQIDPDTQKYAHLKTVDYVAKPDYQYAYGVEDPHTGNKQNHKESRDGDVVHGEYSLIEPDGSLRTVKYTADPKNGFQATVHKQPGYAPPQPQRHHSDDDEKDY